MTQTPTMNLFETDPKKAWEHVEASRRAAMEACPEPLKSYWAAVEEIRRSAVEAITAKNRCSAQLQALERSLNGLTDAEMKGRRMAEVERRVADWKNWSDVVGC